VGLIMLIGIVKKNAIMQIDFALEQERQHGKTPIDAIYEGCIIRFRPIMMTTAAALLGSLPIAFGFGAGGEARQPLGLAVVGGLVVGGRAGGFRLRSDLPIRLNGREYTPPVEIVRNGEGLAVVNELPLEDYLAGAVKAEAGDKMPLEMLKAQAIVARTYAAYHRRLNAEKAYHLLASTLNQQYVGRVAEDSIVWTAVRETAGQVILWNGELFPAFYHTDSGGHTEDPRAVFAATNMPALKPVRVQFPSASPHHRWRLDLPVSELAAALARGGLSVGRVTALDVLERSASLRVVRIAVRGTAGSVTLRGNDLRRLVGYDTLKSTLFAVSVSKSTARFVGRGYGHGVGLDQWSAKTMAEQGYRAQQIVAYYYPGATLSTLPSSPTSR